MGKELSTNRLTLRQWRVDDADSAIAIYGEAGVARWLSPAMDSVPDVASMRGLLQRWIAEDESLISPAGRWAIDRRTDGQLVGGAILLPLPPDHIDLEMGWHVRPDLWGQGYATEAGQRLARWAFQEGMDEVVAVSRPANTRAAATARSIGMEWVGETDKYYGLRLEVYRLRPPDLSEHRP